MDTTPPLMNYSSVLHQPLFDELRDCQRILLAGCGGGYDFLSGIPLFFGLEKAGGTCFLANLTFSASENIENTEKITDTCFKITHNSRRSDKYWTPTDEDYWPEYQVSCWFQENEKRDVPVYMLVGSGVQPLHLAYKTLVDLLKLDAIILWDGGTDSLMFGDECGLGTPTEDMTSIASVYLLKNVKKKILLNLGFGIDCFHGVVHTNYLENIATITRAGGFLGTFSLHPSMEEAKKFEQIYTTSNPHNSIVCSSILSSIQGHYGDHHNPYTKGRTYGSKLYISTLMSMYFAFKLDVVAEHVKYLDRLYDTQRLSEVRQRIHLFCCEKKIFLAEWNLCW